MEGDSPMEIDRNYILVALVLAVVGMLQGLYMSMPVISLNSSAVRCGPVPLPGDA